VEAVVLVAMAVAVALGVIAQALAHLVVEVLRNLPYL